MIKVSELSKSYNISKILDSVTMALRPSQVTSIVSPNGMGKTTLISIIAGIQLPDGGSIQYSEGYDNSNMFIVLAGDKNLYMKNTVKENIYYFSILRGLKKKEINERIQMYKEFIPKYSELENRLAETLSFGQKRLVIILAAIVSGAKCIILDEISEGLDMNHKLLLSKLLEQSKKDRIFFLVSHDYKFVANVSDSIVFLKDGRIVKELPRTSEQQVTSIYRDIFCNNHDSITPSEEVRYENSMV